MLHNGHRDRLKERFLNDKLNNFADHEILEFLLFNVIPRKDTHSMANKLLAHFGSLSAVLNAESHELEEVDGIGTNASILIALMPHLFKKYLSDSDKDKKCLDTTTKVNNYLIEKLAYLKEEEFHMLCLDNSLYLINDVTLCKGSIDKTSIDLKLMNKYVNRYKATNIILAHNHPSGNTLPSYYDDVLTRTIIQAFSIFDVKILDHIIVASTGCFSYYRKGLLQSFLKENEIHTEIITTAHSLSEADIQHK